MTTDSNEVSTKRKRFRVATVLTTAVLILASLSALTLGPLSSTSSAAPAIAFEAKFETASDFYDRFDRGFSGYPDGVQPTPGDHNHACENPNTTSRTVDILGSDPNVDYEQLFWHCLPGDDPAKGHIMTGMITEGYNIAWFSPKQTFSNTKKVCWDINATNMSSRHWYQIAFISASDTTRFPAGTQTNNEIGAWNRGSGGYDLGFTSPEFRPNGPTGPSSGVHPTGPAAFYKGLPTMNAQWFDTNGLAVGAEGIFPYVNAGTTDKAARFKHCLEQTSPGQITVTQDTPSSGTRVKTFPGNIPQGSIRVVFEDDQYDGPKSPDYDPNANTWHWDNLQIYTEGGVSSTTSTTAAPTTTTTAAPTTTTTAAPTTTTTVAPTTTTTTTAPTTTTTTAPPGPVAPDYAVNPAAIARDTRGSVTVNVPGARAGDRISVQPPADLEDDLLYVGARITGDNQVTLYLYNSSTASINGASRVWTIHTF